MKIALEEKMQEQSVGQKKRNFIEKNRSFSFFSINRTEASIKKKRRAELSIYQRRRPLTNTREDKILMKPLLVKA